MIHISHMCIVCIGLLKWPKYLTYAPVNPIWNVMWQTSWRAAEVFRLPRLPRFAEIAEIAGLMVPWQGRHHHVPFGDACSLFWHFRVILILWHWQFFFADCVQLSDTSKTFIGDTWQWRDTISLFYWWSPLLYREKPSIIWHTVWFLLLTNVAIHKLSDAVSSFVWHFPQIIWHHLLY